MPTDRIPGRRRWFGAALAVVFFLAGCGPETPPAESPLTMTGTWTGPLPIGTTDRPFTFRLHERDDGRLMGYVLGGTAFRTIVDGRRTDRDVTLTVELADPGLTRTFTVAGTLTAGGNRLDATADEGGGGEPVTWTRHRGPGPLTEHHLLFAAPAAAPGGEPRHITELSVVRDGRGDLLSGGFVGRADCGLFACGGGVNAFDTTGPRLAIGFEAAGGGCVTTGDLTASHDPGDGLYHGSYRLTDCTGSNRSGALLGARIGRTEAAHVGSMLGSLGRLADDLEAGVAFSAPYAPFSPDYVHNGLDLGGKLAELNAEVAARGDREVTFHRFRRAVTATGPRTFPDFVEPPHIDFDDRRSGVPAGGTREVYRDTATDAGDDGLRYFAAEGGEWVLIGNGIKLGFPFRDYDYADDHLVIHTPGGDVYMSLGPWGAHVGPHTGHLEGNAKADWFGQYAWTLDQLTELENDSGGIPGVCEDGDLCGIRESELLDRAVTYAAPDDDFEITGVTLERVDPSGNYYPHGEHWRVEGRLANFRFSFLHLRGIAADVRDAMVAAGYTDPDGVHSASGNLITGDPVVLAEDDGIAHPQIAADAAAGHPGWYTGKWGTPETPFQQMEIFTSNRATDREESFYTWLPGPTQDRLQAMLNTAASSPLTFRYDQNFLSDWLWRSEMRLSNQSWTERDRYDSIHAALGGWWESTGDPDCDPEASIRCDRLFSIWPVSRDVEPYRPELYEHEERTGYLVALREVAGGGRDVRYGEVVDPLLPEEPADAADTIVIRWRQGAGFDSDGRYQAIAYRADPDARKLRIAWGPFAPTAADALAPPVPTDAAICDGVTLTCHDHVRNPGL